MLGLRVFNIVLLGGGVGVQQLNLQDFDFHGQRLEEQIRVPVALRASAGEYVLEAVPDRFQILVEANKATGYRLEALQANARRYVEDYAGRRSITAVGHNFSGAFDPAGGSPAALMNHLAWRSDFAAAVGVESAAALSVTTRFDAGHGTFATIRLEPDATDATKVFYDINYSYGWPQLGLAISVPVDDAIEAYSVSVEHGTAMLHRLASLGGSDERT